MCALFYRKYSALTYELRQFRNNLSPSEADLLGKLCPHFPETGEGPADSRSLSLPVLS